uniref:PRC domain-containing protein n=1 Tax=Heterorhabditis bacteriophora TaxID=37862 RepID=A0A1I7WRU7_HETBA
MSYIGIVLKKEGQKLGTIEEESFNMDGRKSMRTVEGKEKDQRAPKKSATFHNINDLYVGGFKRLAFA